MRVAKKIKEMTRRDEAREGNDELIARAEARTRAVLRLVTPTLLWLILAAVVIVYSIEGVIWIFKALTGVLLVIILAVFFAYLIAPLVELIQSRFSLASRGRELPRWVAVGVVYLVLFGSLGLGVWTLMPRIGNQLTEIARQSPEYLTNARERAERLNDFYERLNLPPTLRNYAQEQVENAITAAGTYVTGEGGKSALHLLGYVPWLVLVPILAFFFLKDADAFRRAALRMIPQGRLRWRGDEFFQDVNRTLAAYIRAQLIACALIGTICTLGFILLDVRYALVLGITAGLLEFIPLLGPLLVAIMATLVASFDSLAKALAVAAFLGTLRIFHDYFTYPRIIGSGIHLHPLAVILSILVGHELAGVAGIFLAIPVVAIITVTHRHYLEHRGGTGLVAELLKPAGEAAAETAEEVAASQSASERDQTPGDEQLPDEATRGAQLPAGQKS